MEEQPIADPKAELDLVLGVVGHFTVPDMANDEVQTAAVVEVVEGLDPRDFYRTTLSMWWGAIQGLVHEGKHADVHACRDRLLQAGDRGSAAFEAVVSPTLAREGLMAPHAMAALSARVADRAQARRLYEALARAKEKITGGLPSEECLAFASGAVAAVEENTWRDDAGGIETAIEEVLATMRGEGSSASLVATGFGGMDAILGGGLRSGQVVIMAGRPSMGKSSLAFNICVNAVMAGVPVLIFSMEMRKSEVVASMASVISDVPLELIRTHGVASDDQVQRVYEASKALEGKVFVDDRGGLTPFKIMAQAKKHRRRKKIGLIVVDHVGLVKPPGGGRKGGTRENEVSEISREMKAMAGALEVPVIVLCQLNRSVEGREDRRPRLSDLRESGSLEQDADVVCLLFRGAYYWPDNADFDGKVEIDVAKQRGGRTGKVHLSWDGSRVRFGEPRITTMGGVR